MKTETVYLNSAGELDFFVASHKNGHFLQTSFWGRVKNDWKWFGIICRNNEGVITGTLAVLLRRISKTPYHLMYAPRGPVCNLDDFDTIKALIEGAKAEGKKYCAYRLKTDKDAYADNDFYKSNLLSLGFRLKKRTLGFEDFQCRYVFRLNLSGKTKDEVFSSFHAKHRYNIRLAAKRGVEIKICGKDRINDFYNIMSVTGERDGFPIPCAEYFSKILDTFGENARLYTAYYESSPIAGALAVRYGNKVWYFYGGSLNSHRNVMPNHLLQWEMIKWAIESGCEIYDFRGVSGNKDKDSPLYGLYRFKKGFNGEFIEFLGETDLILKPLADKIISASQKIIKLFK
ncbi:MAG: peptidoglycan bridge formation glycyltransferase FemA/FemB family protein [Clostridia bacterium]|nr:peptidoglycan bridge formation glycyltransferase FemA/FemB family protein [Clostridia bacterium]